MADDDGDGHAQRPGDSHETAAAAESATGAGGQSGAARADAEGASADAESVVRRYWDRVWLERDLDALDYLVADRIVRHSAEGTETLTRQQLGQRLAGAFQAVRASETSIDAVTTDGATVWIRLTLRGVSLATSAPLVVAWLGQYRVEGGRIAELWTLHQAGLDWER